MDNEKVYVMTELEFVLKVGRNTLLRMERAGEFPSRRMIGGRAVWLVSEVDEWLRSLPTPNGNKKGD